MTPTGIVSVLVGLWLAVQAALVGAAPVQVDLFDPVGIRHQQPDLTACTAASVQNALNLIALDGQATEWTVSTSFETQERILAYERANMTSSRTVAGSDPVGVRNALNHFGWGSKGAGVYAVGAYGSFDEGTRAIVESIARTRKPVVVFTLVGGYHAQLVTGYRTTGDTVAGVYLTNPLNGIHKPDTFVSLATWRSDNFLAYSMPGSFLPDPLTGTIGAKAWHGKFVAVLAGRPL